MPKFGELNIATRGDREVVMIRDFNAPRQLVFDAFTKPELLRRWLLGPPGWSLASCEMDLRVGGKWRFVWRDGANGQDMAMGGVFREIDKPGRLVHTEDFEGAPDHQSIETKEFAEKSGRTTFTQVTLYASREARDAVWQGEMDSGMEATFDRLDEMLTSMSMRKSGDLKLTTSGDRDIIMTRNFNAPRHLVFDAFTKPELIKRWLLGPDGWSMPVCEVDLRVGGKFRYVWRNNENGQEMGMSGVYRDVDRPRRIINTEQFDEPWYPGEAVDTTEFAESSGRTTVTQTVHYASMEARDGVLKSGMESGVSRSYDRLDELLTAAPVARASSETTTEATQ